MAWEIGATEGAETGRVALAMSYYAASRILGKAQIDGALKKKTSAPVPVAFSSAVSVPPSPHRHPGHILSPVRLGYPSRSSQHGKKRKSRHRAGDP